VEGTMLVSYVILWVLVIVLSLLVLALARQVGVLHERVAPAGALMPTNGPKVGEMTEIMSVTDLQGDALAIGGADSAGLATLILFISPTCPVCKSLVPVARSLVSYEGRRMRLVFASDGDKIEQHIAYVSDLDIKDYPYVVSQALGLAFAVSKLPFAILVGSDGTLQSKGLVNSREHLESLVESMDSGVASLQDYVERNMPEFDESIREKAS
jgi:methylamine dehydrogenase accessory protein MauD